MIEGIVIGVAVGVAMLIINSIVHRTGITTKTDRMEKDIESLKEGQTIIVKSLIAILCAIRDGKTNGECTEALHDLNEYLANLIKK